MENLDLEVNNIVSCVKKQKEIIEDKIKILYKQQIEQLDESKKILNNSISHLNQILANTMRMIQKLESIIKIIKINLIFITKKHLRKKKKLYKNGRISSKYHMD